MKAGTFNIHDYLERLNEALGENSDIPNVEGDVEEQDGILIPGANKKAYDWLKKEYQANQTEVKVEVVKNGAKFEPDESIQASNDGDKNLKPGMFGNEKAPEVPKEDKKESNALEDKKKTSEFTKDESKPDENKEAPDETKKEKDNINNKEEEPKEEKPKEDSKEEKPEEEKEEKSEDPKVKKVDLKTKKK